MAESRARAGAAAALLCCAVLASVAHAQPAAGPELLRADEPRAFGYFVGDVVERRLLLRVPAGMVLEADSLPRTRRPGQALELRRVDWQGGPELRLQYQIFFSPTEVRTLELPPLQLRFSGPGGERRLRVEAWPVTVAPLVPVEVSPRTGLGDLRPDAPPPPLDTAPTRQRLWLYAALLLVVAAWLAQIYIGLPWLQARRRPFALAWRDLQAAAARRETAAPAAYERLHAALNASAGEVLFAAGVERFLIRQPRYAALRGELLAFFARSHALFFAGNPQHSDGASATAAADLAALRELGRALRDAERGSA